MERSFLFLGFDGVLHTERHDDLLSLIGRKTSDAYGPLFSPSAVRNLRRIIGATDAGIVIASNWRHFGLEQMRKMWKDRNLPGEIVDVLPYLPESKDVVRGQEIEHWFEDNNAQDAQYAIIDDRNDYLPWQFRYLVLTNYKRGITLRIAIKVIKILQGRW